MVILFPKTPLFLFYYDTRQISTYNLNDHITHNNNNNDGIIYINYVIYVRKCYIIGNLYNIQSGEILFPHFFLFEFYIRLCVVVVCQGVGDVCVSC